MAVGSVLIALQASRRDGRGVTTGEFLTPLAIQSNEVEAMRADGGPWKSGMVHFKVVRHSDFAHVDKSTDAGAQTEAFFKGIEAAFLAVAKFFDRRSPEVTTTMQESGLSIRLFVEIRMDQDQMELALPSELMAACGRHGLAAYIISNGT